MEKKICPYPGLRPFTESESIFFKGREVHIRQIIRQLEEKKFIMITGASGDGKSSLVYAGVIPNARAGFFRAKFNNWLITDFRPERSPLQNLARTIATHLELELDYVEEELSYGFSALVDLYKNSPFYIDYESEKWTKASKEEQKLMKQKASNLFILADQFEEFFTNSENFTNNKPSTNAYTTINLLLETAQIAAAADLPIYIAFTMRSDYISQSVAFKGLPEFIGFSQFFVPRLKRNELQQIIEEPAVLSGGKVSKSLSEKLINDLPNGFDQLPLLQHIMNRLWKTADDGNQELGLLHLAKIAGIPSKILKKEDRELFDQWLLNIEDFRQEYYDKPVLTNVLNTHANILYQTAFDYFSKKIDWAKQNITKQDAQFILKIAFKSLTKIDEGRAVRNRMTLREITQIINLPHITYETVCGVMNIFRLQDSTFVRPFINDEDIATQYLAADDTFDITHEALIRNWKYLQDWEAEEMDNLSNLKDFQIQLNRWKENNKSTGFLLAAGALAYFEDWYKKSKPNKYWIAKYDNSSHLKEEKLENAEKLSNEIVEFLQASSKHLLALKRKQQRLRTILLIAAAAIILILSGVAYFANHAKLLAQEQAELIEQQKKKAEQQKEIAEEQKEIALEATELAKEEKKRAEQNAYEAMKAKILSDSARTEAQKMRAFAELSSTYAKQEAEKAKTARDKADELRIISEEEKKIAQAERERANTLSYLAMAQSLALKAKQNYNDPQVNLLLAQQAYIFNKQHGGNPQDAEIYKALNYAVLNAGVSNQIQTEKLNFTSFSLDENDFLTVSKQGNVQKYDFKGGKPLFNQNNSSKVPLNSAFILDQKTAVVGYEDKTVYLWNFDNGDAEKLPDYSDYIRGAVRLNSNKIAISDRQPTLKIWNLDSKKPKLEIEIGFESRINHFIFLQKNNTLIAACNDGNIISVNLLTYEKKIVFSKKTRATALALSENQEWLSVGYANGTVDILNVTNLLTLKSTIYASTAGITALAFAKNSTLLAIASDDKRINLYNALNIQNSPITIADHEQNVKNIALSKNQLFALCDDNTFRVWELSNQAYAEKVKTLIKRELSDDEWIKYIGTDLKRE